MAKTNSYQIDWQESCSHIVFNKLVPIIPNKQLFAKPRTESYVFPFFSTFLLLSTVFFAIAAKKDRQAAKGV
ncbi:hypothetical protein A3Q36_16560 [Geobacillus stearothermophilus]|nr:hypothetical protein A3Q36_16560 [Geobacillus stearothermophilus]